MIGDKEINWFFGELFIFKIVLILITFSFFAFVGINEVRGQTAVFCANYCTGSPWTSHCGRTCWDMGCPCPSPPTCTASCTAWSSCIGGSQSRTCTKTDCSTYTDTQSCCIASSACAAYTCLGSTCRDGCGNVYWGTKCCVNSWTPATSTICSGVRFTQTSNCGTTRTATGTKCCVTSWTPLVSTICSGTSFTQISNCGTTRTATGTKCCDTSWSPDASTICSGTSFTQTSNCGTTQASVGTKCCDTSWSPDSSTVCAGESYTQISNCSNTQLTTGTKTCQSDYCNTSGSPYVYCSGNELKGKYSFWDADGCVSGDCQGNWNFNTCGEYLIDNCGTDTCNTSGVEYEYCQDGNVWVKNDGTDQGCAASACYNNPAYCNHQLKETCETGYTCNLTATDKAECVAKSATWMEE